MSPDPASLPLAGLTIVEALSASAPIDLRLAAGMAGRIAADLGARVVLLEEPGGSPLRRWGLATEADCSAVFAFLGAGKKSVIDQPAVAAHLLAGAGAIIADTARPDLPPGPVRVLLSMLADERAVAPHSAFTIMALGGLLDIVGDPARPPLRLGGHQLAYAAGLAAYAGLVAALLQRPTPDVARVALLDVAVWLNWKSVATVASMGTLMTRPGRGAEWPVLRCADGYVALVYQPADWPALRQLCDDARLDDARFATPESRRTHAPALADIVEQALGGMTRAALQARSMALRLPLGPVWTIDELRTEPQLTERGFFTGALGVPRLPVLWNGLAFPLGPLPVPARLPA